MRVRRSLALLTMVVALGAPSAALAQSAGDDQYSDPLGTQTTPSSGSQGAGGSTKPGASGTGQGSSGAAQGSSGSTSPRATPATTAAPAELARTGFDVRLIAVAGLVLLAAGLALRRAAHGRP